jgi:hypothetical protein
LGWFWVLCPCVASADFNLVNNQGSLQASYSQLTTRVPPASFGAIKQGRATTPPSRQLLSRGIERGKL